MAIKPILLKENDVHGILRRNKNILRRAINPQPELCGVIEPSYDCNGIKQPYNPGDILYVRETWAENTLFHENTKFIYRADIENAGWNLKWRPSIHMPKEAARIFVRVKDAREERLQDIEEAEMFQDAIEVECRNCYDWYKDEYIAVPYSKLYYPLLRTVWSRYWDKRVMNMRDGFLWEDNPWCWVYNIERCEKPKEWHEL